MIVFGVFAGISMALRMIARHYQPVNVWWDDAAAIIGFGGAIATTVVGIKLLAAGGREIWATPSDRITEFYQLFWAAEIIYTSTMAIMKISVLFGYLRLFPDRLFRQIVIITITLTFLWGLIASTVFIFQCQPISHFWSIWKGKGSGKCLTATTIIWTASITAIVTDFLMLGMPISQLWPIQMPLRKKVIVTFMLSMGMFVTIVSIIRLHAIYLLMDSKNITYDGTSLALWSVIEVDASVVCMCFPQMRVLLIRFTPHLLDRSHQASHWLTNGSQSVQGSLALRNQPLDAEHSFSSQVNVMQNSQEPPRTPESLDGCVELAHIRTP
ncbi:hypothetical protein EDB81DRAFT_701903 [Dactylonectria macrodidyma]|uniref:Rhodopsin domain-containing protein n=1 Tax=Dactylonectria macrodidyma TaxID=307937 RepID=A0A9P9ID04_9HYPO|nr:hypothetical protein EDB81DRAFT_701903 [Dactylonectria macrodidyma]